MTLHIKIGRSVAKGATMRAAYFRSLAFGTSRCQLNSIATFGACRAAASLCHINAVQSSQLWGVPYLGTVSKLFLSVFHAGNGGASAFVPGTLLVFINVLPGASLMVKSSNWLDGFRLLDMVAFRAILVQRIFRRSLRR